MLDSFFEFTAWLGGDILWGPWTFFGLLFTGVLFTIWTKFTQYRSMTHGLAVIRGVYDDPDDPGAINHFQALSAALSATIGLGNIGGVALAVGAGGPGALVWMWLTGVLGMAIKTVEITLSQMYRNADDPDNPHGGAMWVVEKVITQRGGVWWMVGKVIAFFFCITLLVSAFTGGNMFQSWSVADLSKTYWNMPPTVSGIVLAVIVGTVIVGGIKRIGTVAGRLVPLMCLLYLLAALAVLAMHVPEIPGYFAMIFKSAFAPSEATGAFIGGTAGWAFSTGLRRALFSNEAGQGSAPIAHAAAKTDEPAREGIIGGIGPFVDTLCICTLTGLVILSTGTWNRKPLLVFEQAPAVIAEQAFEASPLADASPDVAAGDAVYMAVQPQPIEGTTLMTRSRLTGTVAADENGTLVVEWNSYTSPAPPIGTGLQVMKHGELEAEDSIVGSIAAMPASSRAFDRGDEDDPEDDLPLWGLLTASQTVEIAPDKAFLWDNLGDVFTVLEADRNDETNTYSSTTQFNRWKILGKGELVTHDGRRVLDVDWDTIASAQQPTLADGSGLFRDYTGASLTAHAFDREFPGLGKLLIPIAAWLFALSTMISWSYYGEQGMIYMLGQRSVLPYKLLYLAGIIFAAGWITTTDDMENLMDVGTGAMLWSNLPIIICLGFLAVMSLRDYDRRFFAGEFKRHDKPDIEDVVSGRDVEKK
jgi:AGCS family alanine or glycine:cation symporter